MSSSLDYEFKVIVVGDPGIGKTCMIAKYLGKQVPGTYVQTNQRSKDKHFVKFQDKSICMEIWDFAGGEKYRTLTAAEYKGAHGVLICYSTTDTDTFTNVPSWHENVLLHAIPEEEKHDRSTKMLVVGLKSDSKKVSVTKDKGEELAESLGYKHFLGTCKGYMAFKEIFQELLVQMVGEEQRREIAKKLLKSASPDLSDASTPLLKKNDENKMKEPSICDCNCTIS